MSSMKIGGVPLDQDEVLEIVLGYAFSDHRVTLTPPPGRDFGTLPNPRMGRFAYRSYDCAARSPGDLDANDVLLAAGLHADMNTAGCLAALAVAPAVSDALDHIPPGTKFWNLPEDEVGNDAPVNSVSWYLHRALWLFTSAPRIGMVNGHAILHHKRPATFPILDESTIELFAEGWEWRQIHQELNTYADEFEAIEWMFGRVAEDRQGVLLTRLRIHDIALWCCANGQAEIAADLGRPFLQRAPV